MSKNIEQELKSLKLAKPPSELKTKALSNAMSAWQEKRSGFVFYRQLRYLLPIAASFAIFLGTFIVLNGMEAEHMRLAFGTTNEKNLKETEENIKFLEEIGLERKYSTVVANLSNITPKKIMIRRFDEEFGI